MGRGRGHNQAVFGQRIAPFIMMSYVSVTLCIVALTVGVVVWKK